MKRTGISKDARGANVLNGRLLVNGEDIGPTFENPAYRIPAGVYRGTIRYVSGKGFVQGPLGRLADTGDFLLAVESVAQGALKRNDILFHGGHTADASEGCIMLGPVSRDANGARIVGPDHPLARLRKAFYGTTQPVSSPDTSITVVIQAEG